MSNMNRPVWVEHDGCLSWGLYAGWKYSGVQIASFWTREGACSAMDKLLWFLNNNEDRLTSEAEYDAKMVNK